MEPGSGLDLQQLMAAAAQMQSKLMTAQQELADALVQGTAGGGLVTAVVNGQAELVELTIDPAAIDASDPQECAQTLADLVLAACRAAYLGAADLQQQMMGPLASGFGEPGGGLPGMPGLPGLGGMFGAADELDDGDEFDEDEDGDEEGDEEGERGGPGERGGHGERGGPRDRGGHLQGGAGESGRDGS